MTEKDLGGGLAVGGVPAGDWIELRTLESSDGIGVFTNSCGFGVVSALSISMSATLSCSMDDLFSFMLRMQ